MKKSRGKNLEKHGKIRCEIGQAGKGDKMKFTLECDNCDGLVFMDKSYIKELNHELQYAMDILLDTSGTTELVCDFPGEKWEVVRERETQSIKSFCNSGKLVIWLLNDTKKECEFQMVDEMFETSKWLHIPTGKLLAVTAAELIQCAAYPELEMETVFELEVEKGWYAVSMDGVEKIKCSLKTPTMPPYMNIQED